MQHAANSETMIRPANVDFPSHAPFAYRSLLFLILIIFIAPMNYIPALAPLRLALVFALFSIVAYVFSSVGQAGGLSVLSAEVKLILWLVFFALISIPQSKWPGGSFDMLIDIFLKSVIVFFLIANLLTTSERFRTFFWALAICAAFNAVVGIYNYRTGAFLTGERIQGGFSGLTSNPNDLALSLDLMIPFIWYLFLSAKSAIQKLMTACTLCVSMTSIVLTSSRGGAITFVGMFLWYLWQRPGKSRATVLVWASLLIGVVLVAAPEGYSERMMSSFDFSKDKSGSADIRWEMTKAGVRQTFEHPQGIGLGMNNLLNHEEGMHWDAGVHNVYLQISTELGLIPGVLFIALLWKLIANTGRIRSVAVSDETDVNLFAQAIGCSLMGFAIAGLFFPVAYHFHFYILAGMAVALKQMADRMAETHIESNVGHHRFYRVMG